MNRRRFLTTALGTMGALAVPPASGQLYYQRTPTQYIAALADPSATSGNNAETWGWWSRDPGPFGVPLSYYDRIQQMGGRGPGGWGFDLDDWWLDENGILMEPPEFPMPAGAFYVTNGEGSYALLTVSDADDGGHKAWSLNRLNIGGVTHGPCRAGRYSPVGATGTCAPDIIDQAIFPLPLGAEPPAVRGCNMVEYEVLIIFGVPVDPPEAAPEAAPKAMPDTAPAEQ